MGRSLQEQLDGIAREMGVPVEDIRQQPAHTLPRISLQEKRDAFHYISSLPNSMGDRNFVFDAHTFATCWDAVFSRDLACKELSILLHRVAMAIRFATENEKTKPIARQLKILMREDGRGLSQWIENARNKISFFNPMEMAVTTSALVDIDLPVEDALLQAYVDRFADDIDNYDPRNMIRTLNALPSLGIEPSRACLDACLYKATVHMQSLDPQSLTEILTAFAAYGDEPPSDFMKEWKLRAAMLIVRPDFEHPFKVHHMADCISAFAVFGAMNNDENAPPLVVRMAKAGINPADLRKGRARLFMNACTWFNLDVNDTIPRIDPRTFRNSHLMLTEIFRNVNESPDQTARYIPEIDHYCDYVVNLGGLNILLKIDGRSHVIQTPDKGVKYRGPAILDAALIKRFSPHILIRLKAPEKDRLLEQPSLLGRVLIDAVSADQRILETCTAGDGTITVRPHLRVLGTSNTVKNEAAMRRTP